MGCATFSPIKDTWHQELIGKVFYTKMPPGALNNKHAIDVKNKEYTLEFDKCKPFKVHSIGERYNELMLHVKQDGNEYYISTRVKYDSPKEKVMNVLSKDFPFKDRKVKLKKGTFSSKELLCDYKYWTGMKEEELYFVKGPPEKTNKRVGSFGVHKQLVYGDFGPYFYIKNGTLSSWQTKLD